MKTYTVYATIYPRPWADAYKCRVEIDGTEYPFEAASKEDVPVVSRMFLESEMGITGEYEVNIIWTDEVPPAPES